MRPFNILGYAFFGFCLLFTNINYTQNYSTISKESLKEKIENQAKKLELNYKIMSSGAAHDAQMIANIAPIAMIFVPSKNGISHSPHEWTDWRHIT